LLAKPDFGLKPDFESLAGMLVSDLIQASAKFFFAVPRQLRRLTRAGFVTQFIQTAAIVFGVRRAAPVMAMISGQFRPI
jgi:hypothetical protein